MNKVRVVIALDAVHVNKLMRGEAVSIETAEYKAWIAVEDFSAIHDAMAHAAAKAAIAETKGKTKR